MWLIILVLLLSCFLIKWLFTKKTYPVLTTCASDPTSHISRFVAKQISLKTPFTDKEFPPNDSSLGKFDEYEVLWIRASDLFTLYNNTLRLFGPKGVQTEDVKQGNLGNCWMMSTLASITDRHPQLIERLFTVKSTNDAGIYEVNLCIGGEWKKIHVDDYLPVHKYSKRNTLFSRYGPNSLWVMILEKAYAKMCGSYAKLHTGEPTEAFRTFIGHPSCTFSLKSLDRVALWKKLEFHVAKKHILVCCTNLSCDRGLLPDHGYSLLGCQEGMGTMLVKLRNPWAGTEWRGDWSDRDWRWTVEARRVFDHHPHEEDGVFFMPYNEFLSQFYTTVVCPYDPQNVVSQIRLDYGTSQLSQVSPTVTSYPIIEIELADDSIIAIMEKGHRFSSETDKGFTLFSNKSQDFLGGVFSGHTEPFTTLRSEHCCYLVPIIKHKQGHNESFVIGVYGKRRATFKMSHLKCITYKKEYGKEDTSIPLDKVYEMSGTGTDLTKRHTGGNMFGSMMRKILSDMARNK